MIKVKSVQLKANAMFVKKVIASFILYLASISQNEIFKEGRQDTDQDIFNKIIREVLEGFRPSLKDIRISHQDFQTGPQEFGDFKGQIDAFQVKGLDTFNIVILKTSMIDINNLTINVNNFTIKGLYKINGLLAFPLGKNDINFFGDGEMSGQFSNFTFSLSMKVRFENGTKIVKALDIFVDLEKLKVNLTNLMGGGDLEKVFNDLINDVLLTVFNYYKKSVLDNMRSELIKQINEMLNKNLKNNNNKDGYI